MHKSKDRWPYGRDRWLSRRRWVAESKDRLLSERDRWLI